MKPGNLLNQGAKSGGRRKMRMLFQVAFRVFGAHFVCFCVRYERNL